jgi:hypothetical protein
MGTHMIPLPDRESIARNPALHLHTGFISAPSVHVESGGHVFAVHCDPQRLFEIVSGQLPLALTGTHGLLPLTSRLSGHHVHDAPPSVWQILQLMLWMAQLSVCASQIVAIVLTRSTRAVLPAPRCCTPATSTRPMGFRRWGQGHVVRSHQILPQLPQPRLPPCSREAGVMMQPVHQLITDLTVTRSPSSEMCETFKTGPKYPTIGLDDGTNLRSHSITTCSQ